MSNLAKSQIIQTKYKATISTILTQTTIREAIILKALII